MKNPKFPELTNVMQEVQEIRKTVEEIKTLETNRLFEEGLFRTIENSSLMGIYVVQDGIFKFVNQHTSNYWGYTREELLGMTSMSIVHPEDRYSVRTCAIDMLKGTRFSPYVFRTIAKNGSIRWITETVTTIHYQGKRAVLGNSMDITEQINARNKLAELEALEASILVAIPHAVIGLKNRRIIFANDGVQTVFGWKAEELIGQRTRRLYRSEKDFKEIAEKLYTTLASAQTVSLEFPCRRKDGKDIVCMINASRIGETLTDKQIVIT
jgi:PAS domain S-box-containing protein